MAYTIAQMRKKTDTVYMEEVAVTPITVNSTNPFGSNKTFEDFALKISNNFFSPDTSYYLRFSVLKIPQFWFSGRNEKSQVSDYLDADTISIQVELRSSKNIDLTPQIIGSFNINNAISETKAEYSSYNFVFSPILNFDQIVFKIQRLVYDAVFDIERSEWLTDTQESQTLLVWTRNSERKMLYKRGKGIIYNGEEGEVSSLKNLINDTTPWIKFGYQCRPGSLIVVNNEPIILGRSGIYEINNGTKITSFSVVSPGGVDSSKIENFLLDYAYKTTTGG